MADKIHSPVKAGDLWEVVCQRGTKRQVFSVESEDKALQVERALRVLVLGEYDERGESAAKNYRRKMASLTELAVKDPNNKAIQQTIRTVAIAAVADKQLADIGTLEERIKTLERLIDSITRNKHEINNRRASLEAGRPRAANEAKPEVC